MLEMHPASLDRWCTNICVLCNLAASFNLLSIIKTSSAVAHRALYVAFTTTDDKDEQLTVEFFCWAARKMRGRKLNDKKYREKSSKSVKSTEKSQKKPAQPAVRSKHTTDTSALWKRVYIYLNHILFRVIFDLGSIVKLNQRVLQKVFITENRPPISIKLSLSLL